MTDAAFPAAIAATLQFEGGYSLDPADPGGETKYGISKRSYPEVNIKDLTRDEAISIYRRDFWDRPHIGLLPDRLAAKVFDLGVNMGPVTAIRLLQRSCNRFDVEPHLWLDGLLGPATQRAVATIAEAQLLTAIRNEAKQHYIDISNSNPALRRFLNGWLRRAAA